MGVPATVENRPVAEPMRADKDGIHEPDERHAPAGLARPVLSRHNAALIRTGIQFSGREPAASLWLKFETYGYDSNHDQPLA